MKVYKPYKALYAKKVNDKTYAKIDKIVKSTGVSKWMVIDKILSEALGVSNPSNRLDLSKWLKI